jgi:hypothetical protein
MTTAEIVTATGLSKASVKRLRAGGFDVLQKKTTTRLLAFLEPGTSAPVSITPPRRTGPRRAKAV